MVNGSTSRIVIIGSLILIAILFLTVAALAILKDPIPTEITASLTLLVGVITGTFFKPMSNVDANGSKLPPGSEAK